MGDYYADQWAHMTDAERVEPAAGHLEGESWDQDAAFVRTLAAERDRYRTELQWFADGDWVEDDPLTARDRAREALRAKR